MRPVQVLLVIFIAGVAYASLPEIQEAFGESSRTVDGSLADLRSRNSQVNSLFSRVTLTAFGKLILTLRKVTSEAWRVIEEFEAPNEWCMEYVRMTFEIYVRIGEDDVQACAKEVVRKLEKDLEMRFWAVAESAQRMSSDGTSEVLRTFSEVGEVFEGSQLEDELQLRLGEFERSWEQQNRTLKYDIEDFASFATSTLLALEECAADAVYWQNVFMDYAKDLVYIYCVLSN